MKTNIAILGPEWTHSHSAAVQFFGDGTNVACYSSFPEIFSAVEQGKNLYGFVPVENSTEGCINQVLGLLAEKSLSVCGVYVHRVHHALIGLDKNVDLTKVSAVFSHSQALGQCSGYVNNQLPKAKQISYQSTSAAIQYIAERKVREFVAIGDERAAKHFGLYVLDRNIEDRDNNETRFFCISKGRCFLDSPLTAFVFSPKTNGPGILCGLLETFNAFDINLLMCQALPTGNVLDEHHFFVLAEMSRKHAFFQAIIQEFDKKGVPFKVLNVV